MLLLLFSSTNDFDSNSIFYYYNNINENKEYFKVTNNCYVNKNEIYNKNKDENDS